MTSYEVSVRGHLDPGLVAELAATSAQEEPANTVLCTEVDDAAGLRTLIERVHGLGLELLAIRRVDGGPAGR
jgi:hypothetical protein